jgi:hypothetical protein
MSPSDLLGVADGPSATTSLQGRSDEERSGDLHLAHADDLEVVEHEPEFFRLFGATDA